MNILDWLFGPSSTVIDADWIQTDLRDMPYSDAEQVRDNSFSSMQDRGVPTRGNREPKVPTYGRNGKPNWK